jgi:hypothetical protein
MPKPSLSKSDFIRSQPTTMSPAEVVAKAKAEGIKLGRSLVYMVRGRSSGKVDKGLPRKTPTPATPAVQSKADFVRSLPKEMPVKSVVEKAKTAGIKLGVHYVYNVRAEGKRATRRKRPVVTSKPVASRALQGGVRAPLTGSSVEDLLKAVAAEIGLGQAVEILARERARVKAVLGG